MTKKTATQQTTEQSKTKQTTLKVRTSSAASTERVAAALARHLVPPLCIALVGPLGAGKTTFVRGLVRGLGSDARIKSPTFALAHSYATTPIVHHLDLYRIDTEQAARELGLDEMIADEAAFACVEWADRAPALLPTKHFLEVVFPASASRTRTLQFSPSPDLKLPSADLLAAARGRSL